MIDLDRVLANVGQTQAKIMGGWREPWNERPPEIARSSGSSPFGDFLTSRYGSEPWNQKNPFQADSTQRAMADLSWLRENSPWGDIQRQKAQESQRLLSKPFAPGNQNNYQVPTSPGGVQSPDEVDNYIRQSAQKRGHDPNIASAVYGSEGKSNYIGDSGSSFGPFQLHYGNVAGGGNAVGGLGDSFTKETGLDARDQSTWQAQVDWVLDKLDKTGWTPYHGAAATGIGQRQGIGTYTAPPATDRTSQFGSGLSYADALAACGPVAAQALLKVYGNNIPIEEVMQAAKGIGWTQKSGMAGPQSEVNLLGKFGLDAAIEGPNHDRARQVISGGNPVIFDTPGHYFLADQYDPNRGYRVGTSGTDLTGGSDWMTPQRMESLMGVIRNIIYRRGS